jgi:hypothetical protein
VFLEEEFLSKERSGSKVTLEEIQDPLPDALGQTEVEQISSEAMEQVQQALRVRRSGRVVHAHERYLGLHEILLIGDIDSLIYHEAREDSGEWLESIKSKL